MEISNVVSIDAARAAGQAYERERDAFWQALKWRPIGEYDREVKPWVIAAVGEKWALAFESELPDDPYYTEPFQPEDGEQLSEDELEWFKGQSFTPGLLWRHAQDCMLWSPLDFEPDRFAEIDEEWQARLAED